MLQRDGGSPMRTTRLIGSMAVALAVIAVLALTGCAAKTGIAVRQHSPIPAGKTCADCHAKDKTHLPPYLGACDKCHQLNSWRTIVYTHASDIFNQGAHGVIGCSRCHTEGTPPPSPDCGGCHEAPHGGWTACVNCHTPITWLLRKPLPAGHLSLAGGHASLSCIDCHAQPQEPAKPRTCTNCHGTRHGGLTDCGRCHDPARGWTPSFDHNTVFRLSGVHATLACTKCHPSGRFFGVSPRCVSCHGVKHGGLTDCARCHTTARFKPSTFRHSSVFPLSPGPHSRLACTRCHPNRQYAKVKGATCVGCHGRVHGMRTCTACHSRTGAVLRGWSHTPFFPLTGAHRLLACSRCHGTPFRPAAGTHCVDCHGTRHGGVTNCSYCHTTTSFSPIKAITHPNGIPLAGHHGSLSGCAECHHTPLNFVSPPRACVDCHAGDVPHVGPSDCVRCHYPVASWATLHFVHPSVAPHTPTEFPCVYCHQRDNIPGEDFTLPRSVICVTCHGPL